ncbi:unnamed protein product [Ilex paraguariensis]|uniref:Uncharacterized protein n=1 Tax=Ilex paraguariensis TaxID=185542 RepID=A0ABC8SP31_9AQUA
MSIIVISGFKFAATFQDSVAIARWVMLQSILAAFILFLNGMFVVTIITIFPVLPAVFAMRFSVLKPCFKSKHVPVRPKIEKID